MTDSSSIDSATIEARALAAGNGLCGLVNNAGVSVSGPVESVPLEAWRRQFEINVFGAVAMTQAMLPLLREHVAARGLGTARVVMISSIAGLIATPYAAPYSSSKFALEAISDSLRTEIRPQGIHVSIIEPGAIDTPIWTKANEPRLTSASPSEALYAKGYEAFSQAAQKARAGRSRRGRSRKWWRVALPAGPAPDIGSGPTPRPEHSSSPCCPIACWTPGSSGR